MFILTCVKRDASECVHHFALPSSLHCPQTQTHRHTHTYKDERILTQSLLSHVSEYTHQLASATTAQLYGSFPCVCWRAEGV